MHRASDSKVYANRVPAQTVGGDCVATVNFPGELPVGSSLEIDVEADMLNLSEALEQQKKIYNVLTMGKEEVEEARKNIRAFLSGEK